MNRKPSSEPSPQRPKRPFVDPPDGPPGVPSRSVGDTRITSRLRTDRQGEPDARDAADSTRGKSGLAVSRLSPPVLVILVTLALALIVLLLVFGGLI